MNYNIPYMVRAVEHHEKLIKGLELVLEFLEGDSLIGIEEIKDDIRHRIKNAKGI